MSENPKSVTGATFVFVLTSSLICPTIFIMGSKMIRHYIGNVIYEWVLNIGIAAQKFVRRSFKRNKISVAPMPTNSVV